MFGSNFHSQEHIPSDDIRLSEGGKQYGTEILYSWDQYYEDCGSRNDQPSRLPITENRNIVSISPTHKWV